MTPMNTMADALRWALRRIETSKLGEGEYFERARQILDAAENSDGAQALPADEMAALIAECRRLYSLKARVRSGEVDTFPLNPEQSQANIDEAFSAALGRLAAATPANITEVPNEIGREHQGTAQDGWTDAGAVGAARWHGPDEHHEHRKRQAGSDAGHDHGDSGRIGLHGGCAVQAQAAVAELPPFYISGPFPDGTYGVCEMATMRILRVFKGYDDLQLAAGRKRVSAPAFGIDHYVTGMPDAPPAVVPAEPVAQVVSLVGFGWYGGRYRAIEPLTEPPVAAGTLLYATPPVAAAPTDIGMVCKTAPERIWLQVDPEPEEDGQPVYPGDDDVTWCSDKINESDTLYIRADLAATPASAAPVPVLTDEQIKQLAVRADLFACIDDAYLERGDWTAPVFRFARAILATNGAQGRNRTTDTVIFSRG